MSEASTSDGRVLVDVGIPTRERPDLVRLAIDSVLAQDLAAWRLVVSENGVGGGATEAAVAPYLKDPRIRYVAHGRRAGRRRELDAADPGGRRAVRRAPARRRSLGSDLPRPAGRVPGAEPVLRVRLLREQGDRRDGRGRARDRVRPARGDISARGAVPDPLRAQRDRAAEHPRAPRRVRGRRRRTSTPSSSPTGTTRCGCGSRPVSRPAT